MIKCSNSTILSYTTSINTSLIISFCNLLFNQHSDGQVSQLSGPECSVLSSQLCPRSWNIQPFEQIYNMTPQSLLIFHTIFELTYCILLTNLRPVDTLCLCCVSNRSAPLSVQTRLPLETEPIIRLNDFTILCIDLYALYWGVCQKNRYEISEHGGVTK